MARTVFGTKLTHAGRISHELAKEHAEKEYDKFHAQRVKALTDYRNDFDKSVKVLEVNGRLKTVRGGNSQKKR